MICYTSQRQIWQTTLTNKGGSGQDYARQAFELIPKKSAFCAIETEYLGYTLKRTGIKPQPKKVQAILTITPPKHVKDIHKFLGMVKYYRDFGQGALKCSPHSPHW